MTEGWDPTEREGKGSQEGLEWWLELALLDPGWKEDLPERGPSMGTGIK